jgi:hypothetical protein
VKEGKRDDRLFLLWRRPDCSTARHVAWPTYSAIVKKQVGLYIKLKNFKRNMKINSKSTINLIGFFVRQLVSKDFSGQFPGICWIGFCLSRSPKNVFSHPS